MLWPSFADYEFFVKNAFAHSVLDLRLKNGNPMKGISGGFSRVYPVKVASNTFALRCWVKDVGNLKERYRKVSAYLKKVHLPYFVDFEYVSEGVLVNGTKYPTTRMEWAEGVSLRGFIEQNLQSSHIFKVVANEFQEMVAALHKHQIAHGDLQDGNILLTKNNNAVEIKLIDYDSLFVPTLQGQPEQIVGLPEYQHPIRITGGGQANEKVDYFSELVIYLSFLSLTEKPELWNRFKDETEKGLLFSKKDFENPDKSGIFQELANLSPNVQQLAATLKDFCAKTSLNELEPLEAILPKSDANIHCNQGESFLNDERYDEALAEFQKAIDIKPDYVKAYFGRGHVYRRTKQYVNAIIAFQQAIKFKTNYKEAHYGLGIAHFESGDNSKAIAAANAALRIDPYYQPARQLLDAIKSAMPPPVPPTPPGPVSPSPGSKSTSADPIPNPVANLWQYITGALKSNWHFVTVCTLGLALVVCFVAFLIQIDAKDETLSQNVGLKNQFAQKDAEIRQKESKIRQLTTSVQTLENQEDGLSRKNSELQDQLNNRKFSAGMTSKEMISLRKQLSEKEAALASLIDENQKLQSQMIKKDTELRTQVSMVEGLENEKTDIRNENRRLQDQLAKSNTGTTDQNAIVRQLQKEKAETLTENRRLRNQKQDLIRQNQNLQRKNKVLQSQLDNAKQSGSNRIERLPSHPGSSQSEDVIVSEPPRQIGEYKDGATRASVYNNNKGIMAFRRKDYDKAATYFKQAVQADLKFAITHYNLGCVYLEMREYGKAIHAFSEAVGIDHKFKEAYYNLGFAHLRSGARKEAKSSAELALKIDSDYEFARNLLKVIENIQQ